MDLDLNARDPDFAFICKCLPGASIQKSVQVAKETVLINNTFSLIIIFAGVNYVTHLIRKPVKLVRTRFLTTEDTVDYLKSNLDEGLAALKAITQIPVAFCPIIGLDLVTYSPQNTRACYQQPIIDQAVLEVNKHIFSINASNHVPTPLIASTIHKCKGKNRAVIHYYAKLHDGCHPDPQTRAVWAGIIFKAASSYLEL